MDSGDNKEELEMLALFRKIMPKEELFFDMFERHAACLTAGSLTLRKLLDGGASVGLHCQTIMQQEQQADDISLEVLQAIRRSFITPFDRSDIKGLITSMDDAIDQMNKTAKAVMLYEVSAFEPEMRKIADQIVSQAALTAEAMPLLRAMAKNTTRLNAITAEVIRLEGETDHEQETGLKKLLASSRQDPMAFIIGAEIYEHLEKVADRFEDVANRVSGILIEHL
jgi:uncharacterized protein